MRMTTTASEKTIILLFFFFCSVTFAQNRTEIDTARAFNLSIPSEDWEYQFNNPSFLTEMDKLSLNKIFINDSSSVWMRTRMMIGAIGSQENLFDNSSSNLLGPLYNNYLETQKLATLKAILGSVQVGAVAYLAYKHIKKYGFLKKK